MVNARRRLERLIHVSLYNGALQCSFQNDDPTSYFVGLAWQDSISLWGSIVKGISQTNFSGLLTATECSFCSPLFFAGGLDIGAIITNYGNALVLTAYQ